MSDLSAKCSPFFSSSCETQDLSPTQFTLQNMVVTEKLRERLSTRKREVNANACIWNEKFSPVIQHLLPENYEIKIVSHLDRLAYGIV
jgi:hypothetical protein